MASPFNASPSPSPFMNNNNNNNNMNLGPPPPLAPRRPPSNAPPPPPSSRQAPQQFAPPPQQSVAMATGASPLTRSLPPAPAGPPSMSFDSSPGGAYVDASAWTVSNNNNAALGNNNNALAPPGAFGRARARSRSVGSLDRPNASVFAGGPPSNGLPPPGGAFNNGGSMRMPPTSGQPQPGGPAKPLKPPKTSKLPVGATSGEAFGTVSPPPSAGGGTIGGPIGARSDSSFGVVQPIQPGGSMRLPPTQQMAGGSFRDVPVGGSLGPRNASQPNFAAASQPSAVVRGQISPRSAPSQPQQQQQQAPPNGTLVSGTDQPVERCVCPKCGKLFYFRSDVETHMRLRHT
jgi:hypothetical protein